MRALIVVAVLEAVAVAKPAFPPVWKPGMTWQVEMRTEAPHVVATGSLVR